MKKLWQIAIPAFFITALFIAKPVHAGVQGTGVDVYHGYFQNKVDNWGDAVLPNGLQVNTVGGFIGALENNLRRGSPREQVGAAFIINLMLDKKGLAGDSCRSNPGPDCFISPQSLRNDLGPSGARAGTTLADWEDRVRMYNDNGWVDWNKQVTYPAGSFNSYWQGNHGGGSDPNDDAFFRDDIASTHPSIVFMHGGKKFEIKKDCGNVRGEFSGLEAPSAKCVVTNVSTTNPQVDVPFTLDVIVTNNGTVRWNAGEHYKLNGTSPSWNQPSPVDINYSGSSPPAVTVNFPVGYKEAAVFHLSITPDASYSQKATLSYSYKDPSGSQLAKCSKDITSPPPVKRKIFAGNLIRLIPQYIRDNYQFVAKLFAYFWPDAGMKSTDAHNRFWVAGSYKKGESIDPNTFNTFNDTAEINCPGASCLGAVPLAYVPNFGTDPTPNGNVFKKILDGTLLSGYTQTLGGIATDSINQMIHGETEIETVEISNIHVQANGIHYNPTDGSLQGGIDQSKIQVGSTTNLWPTGKDLPAGSQGPVDTNGPFNAWDNIRAPLAPNSGFTITAPPNIAITSSNITFSDSPSNFTADPNDMLDYFYGQNLNQPDGSMPETLSNPAPYASVNMVSLLQDGNNLLNLPQFQYSNQNEPITYTTGVTGADDVLLVWDEYVNWKQMDDKGHWYTPTGNVNTGINLGPPSIDSRNNTHSLIYNPYDGSGQRCLKDQGELVDYDYREIVYYTGSTESRYGWLNSSAAPTGGTYFPNPSSNPTWASTTTPYWQDTSITLMDSSGSSNRQSHLNNWMYNTTDPTYYNKTIYNIPVFRVIPIARHKNNQNQLDVHEYCLPDSFPGSISRTPVGPYTFYPNAAPVISSGLAASWQWVSNWQYTMYEQTFTGHTKDLGTRSMYLADPNKLYGLEPSDTVKPARAEGFIYNPLVTVQDNDIFAAGNINSYFMNSTFSSALLFANGVITHFAVPNSSNSVSAIALQGYCNNVAQAPYLFNNRTTTQCPGPAGSFGDVISQVFRGSFSQLSSTTNIVDNSNIRSILASLDGKVYKTLGDLTINGAIIGNINGRGSGTIIVNGDLTITGDMSYYEPYNGDKSQLPSLGIIVTGNVYVNQAVSKMAGAYLVANNFITLSCTVDISVNSTTKLITGINPTGNRSCGDNPLTLNGLVVANGFSLNKQPSGEVLANGQSSEAFIYDGRIAINTPPGFNSLFSTPAVWNESVPRN